jgi:DNA recombination protein RmuC
MTLPDFVLYAILALGLVSLVLLVLLLLKQQKPGPVDPKLDLIGERVGQKIDDMKSAVSQTLFDSILKFNDQVNQKLSDTNDKSSANITDFRLNVNKELAIFKDEISTKLNTDFKGLTAYLESQMGRINQNVEARLTTEFTKTNDTFMKITERISVIDEAQKKIETLSGEMVSLQKMLANNQSRGMFGEYQLNQLLSFIYGDNDAFFKSQYTIKEARGKSESVRADAAIFMPEPIKLIAIDSKFPFSAYRKLFEPELTQEEEKAILSEFLQNVKKHITDIASKYIISGVTADFALMFVPSDGVLSLIHAKLPSVVELARTKNVTIVSPTTLIPLLSSFKAISIDHQRSRFAFQIRQELHALEKDFATFEGNWTAFVVTIDRLSKNSGTISKDVEKITKKFNRIKEVDIPENPSEETSETNAE